MIIPLPAEITGAEPVYCAVENACLTLRKEVTPVIVLTEQKLRELLKKFWNDNSSVLISEEVFDSVLDQWLAKQLEGDKR